MLANWLQNSLPEELAMYILSLTVQDPDSLPEVEIARENHCHLNHLVVALVGKARGRGNGRRGDQRRDRNRRDDREGGRRDFKRKSNKNSRDFEGKGNKRPHRTSNEKKNGFVIRNKGDK